jgi:1-acyl-sn-glycerol-3-phosphate acyltransferase
VISSGAIDVVVSWGEPVAYNVTADRKEIARVAEASVRRMTASALRAAPSPQEPVDASPEVSPATA